MHDDASEIFISWCLGALTTSLWFLAAIYWVHAGAIMGAVLFSVISLIALYTLLNKSFAAKSPRAIVIGWFFGAAIASAWFLVGITWMFTGMIFVACVVSALEIAVLLLDILK